MSIADCMMVGLSENNELRDRGRRNTEVYLSDFSCHHYFPRCGQRVAAKRSTTYVLEYRIASRAARCRSGASHDPGRKGHASGKPVARNSAVEYSNVRLVERGVAWRREYERYYGIP